MLPSVECGRRLQGIEPAGATYFGRVEALDECERRDWSRQLTRFAIQHPNAIMHARLEFRRRFEVHFCRPERLVVEPQRDGKASRNMLRSSLDDRNRRPRTGRVRHASGPIPCATESMRNIVLGAT